MEQRWNMQPQQVCIYVRMLLPRRYSQVGLCNPTDGSPPGSPVPGILQARTLGWVAISFSSMCVCVYSDVCVYVCVCRHIRVSQVVQLVKSMSAIAGDQEMRVQSLGQENPPE